MGFTQKSAAAGKGGRTVYYDKLLNLGAELGRTLMSSGAEIYRVEESVSRLLSAYGQDPQVFALPSCLFVGITTPEGRPITKMCRIPSHGFNIELLERCNDLCRRLCAEVPDVDKAMAEVRSLTPACPAYPPWFTMLAYAITSAFFALFFGGCFRDFLCAFICGVAVGFLLVRGTPFVGNNTFLHIFVCSAVVSSLSIFLTHIGLGVSSAKITIGVLMVLVPGMALTNAMREIMAGDIFSGLNRTAEVILVATSIALGTAVPFVLANGI